jgi:hypothetical protein
MEVFAQGAEALAVSIVVDSIGRLKQQLLAQRR